MECIKKAEPKIETKISYKLKIFAKNNGNILVNFLNAYLFFPTKYRKEKESDISEIQKIFMDNTIRDVVDSTFIPTMNGGYSNPKYGPSRYEPILPKRYLMIKDISVNENFANSQEELKWIVFSDNAEPRSGKILINEIKIYEK